ncbi:PREDICTED: uncharacterized protein LOC107328973 isoform X5 [Acropora digitifera]|uniref:uncharacterized protein LOC107328973 isoform X5 n=1 Tax=Acropora digitifera TaxID=70779 RepID=UPI00077B066B|nr:PREDICTED: uncharacterized protein LOC107328973 isoform X5 [Acropora digitifera]
MEPSFRSQQNPPELEVIGEQSTPRSTDQDPEENQCQTSVFREPLVAENKKCAVEHEDFTDLPDGEEKEEARDGSSQEKMEVDNTEQCHGPVSCIEPSTAPAKQRAAKKKKCATEHVDVTYLPGGEKDRDGIVPGRVKDKEDDLDSSQEKKPWAAEKKMCRGACGCYSPFLQEALDSQEEEVCHRACGCYAPAWCRKRQRWVFPGKCRS